MNDFEKSLLKMKNPEELTEQEVALLENGGQDTATPVIDAETSQINTEAKSPYQMTKPEIVQEEAQVTADQTVAGQLNKEAPQGDTTLSDLKANIERYKTEMDAKNQPNDKDKVMNWLTGVGQGANAYNAASGVKDQKVKYWDDKQGKQDQAQKEKKLEKVTKLQKMYQDYMTAQKKTESKKATKDKIYQTRSGLVKLKEDGTVDPIYTDPYMKSTGDVRKESLGLRKEKFANTKVQKNQDDAVKAIDSLRKTDTWKSAEKAVSNIPEITVLLEDAYRNGGQSLAMLGPKVAKGIAGEVGVLTEQDVTRYVKNPALVGGMLDTLSKAKSGKLTQASYENLKRLLQISKQTATDKMTSAIDREAILLSRREKMPFEDAKYLLDSAYKVSPQEKITQKENKDGNVRVQLPSGKIGVIPSANLKAFKKKYPKGKILD